GALPHRWPSTAPARSKQLRFRQGQAPRPEPQVKPPSTASADLSLLLAQEGVSRLIPANFILEGRGPTTGVRSRPTTAHPPQRCPGSATQPRMEPVITPRSGAVGFTAPA